MTYLLIFLGATCMGVSIDWKRTRAQWHKTIPQIHRENLYQPHRPARWRLALTLVGVALFWLGFWRQLSGL
jgi:hypothetical protein